LTAILSNCSARICRQLEDSMYCLFRIAAHLFGAAIASFVLTAHELAASHRRRVPTKESRCACHAAKYRSITAGQEWENPYVIVQAKGIDAWPISPATKIPTMAPADVVAYLFTVPELASSSVTIVQQAPQKSCEAILAGYYLSGGARQSAHVSSSSEHGAQCIGEMCCQRSGEASPWY
jgi:hypothetical protein